VRPPPFDQIKTVEKVHGVFCRLRENVVHRRVETMHMCGRGGGGGGGGAIQGLLVFYVIVVNAQMFFL